MKEAAKEDTPAPAMKPAQATQKGNGRKKSTTPEATPSTPEKRKSQELEGDTLLNNNDKEALRSSKKGKSSSKNTKKKPVPKSKTKGERNSGKIGKTEKKDITPSVSTSLPSPAPPTTNAAPTEQHTVSEQVTQVVQDSIPLYTNALDPALIAAQVTVGVHTGMQPYLDILEPLMEFQLICAKLKGAAEEDAQTWQAAVKSVVDDLQKKHGKDNMSEAAGSSDAKSEQTKRKSGPADVDIDDGFTNGFDDEGDVDL